MRVFEVSPARGITLLLILFGIMPTLVLWSFLAVNATGSDSILPRPQSFRNKGFELTISAEWVIVTNMRDERYRFSALWLERHLIQAHSLELKILDFSSAPPSHRIVLGSSQHPFVKSLLIKKGILVPPSLEMEGYVLDVSRSPCQEITIAADAPNGVFYGVETLLQLFRNESVIGAYIIDYPDHRIRATDLHFFRRSHLRGKPPRFTVRHRKIIDSLASLKINTISLDTGTDFFRKSHLYHKAYIQLVKYCRERFMDVIPQVGTLRNIAWVPFDLIEGWWIRDEVFYFGDDDFLVPVNPPYNLLSDGGFEHSQAINAGPDRWKFSGDVGVDSSLAFKGRNSLKITKGRAVVEFRAKPNSFYHLSVYAKGAPPVIALVALSSSQKRLYGQNDYAKSEVKTWRKFGVVLATGEQTAKVRVVLTGKNKYRPVWIDSVKVRRINGALQNVIRTLTTDIKITSTDKTSTYQEGRDYVILNGQTSKIYDEDLRPCRIRRLKEGRISPFQKVLVSYDSVLYWSRTHWYNQPPCVSDKRLFTDYYYPALDRVIKLLHPRIMHLGSDEIRGFNRDSRNRRRGLTNAVLFAEWLNKIDQFVKKKDANCRVMIWDDMVSPYHNGKNVNSQLKYGGSPGRLAEAVEQDMISKDVIMNIWWYSNHYYPLMVAAAQFFESKGFDYLGACWAEDRNIRSWARLLFKRPHALGGFATNWGRNNFSVFADYFWNTYRTDRKIATHKVLN